MIGQNVGQHYTQALLLYVWWKPYDFNMDNSIFLLERDKKKGKISVIAIKMSHDVLLSWQLVQFEQNKFKLVFEAKGNEKKHIIELFTNIPLFCQEFYDLQLLITPLASSNFCHHGIK